MRFLSQPDRPNHHELTYADVFLVPGRSAVVSRLDVDLTSPDGTGTTIPLVASNMTAVSGRRMAETAARRGAMAVLPQDVPLDVVARVVARVKACHPVAETAITLTPGDTVLDALHLMPKRAHGVVVVVDGEEPVGVVSEADCRAVDRFTQLREVMSPDPVTVPAELIEAEPGSAALVAGLTGVFDLLHRSRRRVAPVLRDGRLVGVLTRIGALRSTIYAPALDAAGRLRVGAAIGINGDVAAKAKALCAAERRLPGAWTPRTATRSGCWTRCG